MRTPDHLMNKALASVLILMLTPAVWIFERWAACVERGEA
jgi:hypothetical protein